MLTHRCHQLGVAIAACIACIAFAAIPAQAKEDQAPEATIHLGERSGCSHPTKHGHAYTGGGDISVSQPTPDTLIVRMNGAVAACGNPFCDAYSMMDFVHDLDFHVDVTPIGHPAKLLIESHAYGLLRGRGKTGTAEMTDALAMLTAGPSEIITLTLPPSCIVGCESLAPVNSRGPVCVPICAGCYHLRQQFKISAYQKKCFCGGKVSADFSPSQLPDTWLCGQDPFSGVDKKDLGYIVTIQVVPEPLAHIISAPTETTSNKSQEVLPNLQAPGN